MCLIIVESWIWTNDLLGMSQASYLTALSRDIILSLSWLYSLMDNHKVLVQTLILTITIGFYRRLAINTLELYIVKIDDSEFSIWSLNIEHSIFFAYTVRIQYLPSDINQYSSKMVKNRYTFLIIVLRERVQIHGFRTITTVFIYLLRLKLDPSSTVWNLKYSVHLRSKAFDIII